MTDDANSIRNMFERLSGDMDDESFGRLTEPQRAAALVCVLHGRVRMDGIAGWVETHGPQSAGLLWALRLVGATPYLEILTQAFGLFPTLMDDDPDIRLSAMDSWADSQSESFSILQGDYFHLERKFDLIEHYLAQFVAAYPQDFRRASTSSA